MTVSYLQLTALDPIVARDGRPFGIGQGNRMRGLTWPYPSVVAGSFRTALVKAMGSDFSGDMPQRLMGLPVAGVFPVADKNLYLPAPNDCVYHPDEGPLSVCPQDPPSGGGCNFPINGLRPVMLTEAQAKHDFKPLDVPAWWPVAKLAKWLTESITAFDDTFLASAQSQVRDHVQLEAETGAAAESLLFATTGLCLTHLPRFGSKEGPLKDKYAEINLTAQVQAEGWTLSTFNILHPLGGERRLVHWQADDNAELWKCPPEIAKALCVTKKVRLALATPAVFAHGWRREWLDENTLEGTPPGSSIRLKLVGVCIPRWKAVSGWSLAVPRGPKPVKRLVPAGGVYFFETSGDPASLAEALASAGE